MELVIRDYRPADFAACRALWAELTQRHRDIYDDPTIGGDDPGQELEPYLANEHLRGPWVAELSGEIAGLAGLLIYGEEAEIEPVIVTARHRSHGIGAMLVEHATRQARAGGVRFLSVRPVARNVEALAFFVRAGFDIVGHVDLFQDLSTLSTRRWKPGITLHGKPLRY